MKRHPSICSIAFAGIGLAWCSAPNAVAQGDWELVDRELHRERVELTQCRDGLVWFIDADGRTRTEKVASLVAIVHTEPPPDRPARELPWIRQQTELFGPVRGTEPPTEPAFDSWLELTDGQHWSGSLIAGRGESLTWSLRGVLELPVPLERVHAMALRAPGGEPMTWVDDQIVLINGDALTGFLAALGDPTRVEGAEGVTEVPLERVAAIALANPPTEPRGMMVWTDADVLAVAAVEVRVTGRVGLHLGSESPEASLELPTSDLRAVLLDPGSVSPLGSITPERAESSGAIPGGVEPRAAAWDLPLGAATIGLRGPVVVSWSLPRPGVRFAAKAVLPPAMWAWGDCDVVVRAAGTELFRERLNGSRPEVVINVPLGGSLELEIEVDPGESGAVQDHIELEAPMISWR
ncbi:MAG: hypothetical protein IPJ41_06625 [Phycisphaerales bacterium]|nr:hypothetical protein [Phycisphaerales bacterium]